MIGNQDESPPKQENLASLPDNLSQASLVSLDRNGFTTMKYLKHNNPQLVKSFTPPYHLSSMQRYPYKSTPSFYVTLIEESMDGFLHPEGNMNNNVKLKSQNQCNGRKKESKKFKSPLQISKNVWDSILNVNWISKLEVLWHTYIVIVIYLFIIIIVV